MNTSWLKAKQTKFTAYVSLYILVVLAVLGVANFLAQRHNKSWDLTSNKRFSLSDQTIKVVSGLKQDVKIMYFDQSSRFAGVGGAKDLLDRYDNLSPKLSVEYIDPDKKPQLAKANGVRSYGTTFVDVGGKREEAKSVTEEEITGALIRALKGGQRTACITQGNGEHGLEDSDRDGYSGLKDYLERNNYRTQALNLLQKNEIPKECTAVMVGGPTREYPEPVATTLKSYVEGGGRALIMLDPPVKFQGSETDDNPAITKVLEEWGVKLNKDVVLDPNPMGQLFGFGAATPLVANYESHPIVREMRGTTTLFPFTRSVEVLTGKKATVDKLFSTSDSAFTATDLTKSEIKPDKRGSFVLGAAGTIATGNEKQQGRFVVTGTSSWVSNRFLRQAGNRDLVMNMFNWLSQDEDLISIRPKEPEDRRLTLSARQMNMLGLACVILLPLMIVAAGVSVWWKRR
jgi:ABC-type uncharacterized transport system involved in gliding motility auxiliary subunit